MPKPHLLALGSHSSENRDIDGSMCTHYMPYQAGLSTREESVRTHDSFARLVSPTMLVHAH